MELIEEILEKAEWVCTDHEECKTCKYYYYSCCGLFNPSDPRYTRILENDKWFIQTSWNLNQANRNYMIWLRFKEIGMEFKNLTKVRCLTLEKIEKLLTEAK